MPTAAEANRSPRLEAPGPDRGTTACRTYDAL